MPHPPLHLSIPPAAVPYRLPALLKTIVVTGPLPFVN